MEFSRSYANKEKLSRMNQNVFSEEKKIWQETQTNRTEVLEGVRKTLLAQMSEENKNSNEEAKKLREEHKQVYIEMVSLLANAREATRTIRDAEIKKRRAAVKNGKNDNTELKEELDNQYNIDSEQFDRWHAQDAPEEDQPADPVWIEDEDKRNKVRQLSSRKETELLQNMNDLWDARSIARAVSIDEQRKLSFTDKISLALERMSAKREIKKAEEERDKAISKVNEKAAKWKKHREEYSERTFKKHYEKYDQIARRYRILTRNNDAPDADFNAAEHAKHIMEYQGIFDEEGLQEILNNVQTNPYMGFAKLKFRSKKDGKAAVDSPDTLLKEHSKIVMLSDEVDENGLQTRYKMFYENAEGDTSRGVEKAYSSKRQFSQHNPTALSQNIFEKGAELTSVQGEAANADEINFKFRDDARAISTGDYIFSKDSVEVVKVRKKGFGHQQRYFGIFLNGEFIPQDATHIKNRKQISRIGNKFSLKQQAEIEELNYAILKSDFFDHVNSKSIEYYMGYGAQRLMYDKNSENMQLYFEKSSVQLDREYKVVENRIKKLKTDIAELQDKKKRAEESVDTEESQGSDQNEESSETEQVEKVEFTEADRAMLDKLEKDLKGLTGADTENPKKFTKADALKYYYSHINTKSGGDLYENIKDIFSDDYMSNVNANSSEVLPSPAEARLETLLLQKLNDEHLSEEERIKDSDQSYQERTFYFESHINSRIFFDRIRMDLKRGVSINEIFGEALSEEDNEKIYSRSFRLLDKLKGNEELIQTTATLLLSEEDRACWDVAKRLCSEFLPPRFAYRIKRNGHEGMALRMELLDELSKERKRFTEGKSMLGEFKTQRHQVWEEDTINQRGAGAKLKKGLLIDRSILQMADSLFGGALNLSFGMGAEPARWAFALKQYTALLTMAPDLGLVAQGGAMAAISIKDGGETIMMPNGKEMMKFETDTVNVGLSVGIVRSVLGMMSALKMVIQREQIEKNMPGVKAKDTVTTDKYYQFGKICIGCLAGLVSCINLLGPANTMVRRVTTTISEGLGIVDDIFQIIMADRTKCAINDFRNNINEMQTALSRKLEPPKEGETQEERKAREARNLRLTNQNAKRKEQLDSYNSNSQYSFALQMAHQANDRKEAHAGADIIKHSVNIASSWMDGTGMPVDPKACIVRGAASVISTGVDVGVMVYDARKDHVETRDDILARALANQKYRIDAKKLSRSSRKALNYALQKQVGIKSKDYLLDVSRIMMGIDTHFALTSIANDRNANKGEQYMAIKIANTMFHLEEPKKGDSDDKDTIKYKLDQLKLLRPEQVIGALGFEENPMTRLNRISLMKNAIV